MEDDGDSLYLQLHKLSAVAAEEEEVEHILTTLWKTRRTGLPSLDKSRFQSLLNLPSLPELDPVLACLRSIIRKSVHENFSSDDFLKLFPPDLSLDLQTTLITLLQKYQNRWKEEISTEQHSLPRTSVSYQVRTSVPPSFTCFQSSEIPTQLWPRQDDANGRFNHNGFGASTSIVADTTASVSMQQDVTPPDNLLQDYTKSPSGETEVKFQLSRDTLEAVLRSMTYIIEQLSSMVGTSSGPAQKKQKQ